MRYWWIYLWVLATGVAGAGEKGEVFGLERVWEVHLRVSGEDWRGMQPARGARFGAGTRPATREGERLEPSAFGFEYRNVRGTIQLDGETYEVGVRFKGNASYALSSHTPRRPLKIDFSHYRAGQTFHGLKSINLHNNTLDPSQLREALAYSIFRDARVPAPRTAFALVYLTVDGVYEREYLGLYTMVEQIDKKFLERHFESGRGLLLKPEGIRGLPYMGAEWADWKGRYNPKGGESKEAEECLMEFLHLVQAADDDKFRCTIGAYLDVDEFLRFVAVQTLIANLDSFLCTGHNYYLYIDPADGRVAFLPWDMHLSFAGFGWGGTMRQQMELSIRRPYVPANRLISRMLAIDGCNQAYREHLKELSEGCFSPGRLRERIEAMEKVVARADEAARVAGRAGSPTTRTAGGLLTSAPKLKEFAVGRAEAVRRQLAGTEAGFVPLVNLQGPMAQAHPMESGWPEDLADRVLSAIGGKDANEVEMTAVVGAVRKFFAAADRKKEGSLDERELADALARVIPASTFATLREPGPALLGARAILRMADSNRDGRVSLEEMVGVVRRVVKADARGRVGYKEIREGLGRMGVGE